MTCDEKALREDLTRSWLLLIFCILAAVSWERCPPETSPTRNRWIEQRRDNLRDVPATPPSGVGSEPPGSA